MTVIFRDQAISENKVGIDILEEVFGELVGIYHADIEPPEYIFEDSRLDLDALAILEEEFPQYNRRFLAFMLVDNDNDLEYLAYWFREESI